MKRALAAFTLVLLLAPAILALLALERSLHESRSRALQTALALEQRKAFELEVKGALKSALASVPRGLPRAERAYFAGERVAAWASWLERRAVAEGLQARAWCGSANEEELESMLASTLERRETAVCTACLSPASYLADGEGRPVRACAALLDEGHEGVIEVSRAGLARVPAAAVWALPAGLVGIGASVHSPRAGWASLFLLPEGFRGDFGHG